MIFKIWSGLFLLLCAAVDLKTKKVYQSVCIINYGLAVVIKLIIQEADMKSILWGLLFCVMLFGISVITKEAIGQGDVLILLVLTSILNVESVLEIFGVALFLCSLFSVVMLFMKKVKGKDTIPFVPFLVAGHGVWMILGG